MMGPNAKEDGRAAEPPSDEVAREQPLRVSPAPAQAGSRRSASWPSTQCGACFVGRWLHAGLGWSWMLRTMRREPCAVCVMRDTHGPMAMRHAMDGHRHTMIDVSVGRWLVNKQVV